MGPLCLVALLLKSTRTLAEIPNGNLGIKLKEGLNYSFFMPFVVRGWGDPDSFSSTFKIEGESRASACSMLQATSQLSIYQHATPM